MAELKEIFYSPVNTGGSECLCEATAGIFSPFPTILPSVLWILPNDPEYYMHGSYLRPGSHFVVATRIEGFYTCLMWRFHDDRWQTLLGPVATKSLLVAVTSRPSGVPVAWNTRWELIWTLSLWIFNQFSFSLLTERLNIACNNYLSAYISFSKRTHKYSGTLSDYDRHARELIILNFVYFVSFQ